ncbi:MAG TPA: hypothetical protein VF170_16685 [Planctomycetaceae bacterium]
MDAATKRHWRTSWSITAAVWLIVPILHPLSNGPVVYGVNRG